LFCKKWLFKICDGGGSDNNDDNNDDDYQNVDCLVHTKASETSSSPTITHGRVQIEFILKMQ